MVQVAVVALLKPLPSSVALTQAQARIPELPEHRAQPTLVAVAVAACLADLIVQQVPVVQELALLGIGVRNGTLCKN
jgi:hypothetical protein